MQEPGEKPGAEFNGTRINRAKVNVTARYTDHEKESADQEGQPADGSPKEKDGSKEKNTRHLLLVMPAFFDLPEKIMEAARKLGWETLFIDDRPSECTAVKALLRLNRNLLPIVRKRYCEQVIRKVSAGDYDVVLVISGQSLCFDEETMDRLRFLLPRARFVLYQWDSLANFPGIARLWPWFDRRYTFDPKDAREHPELSFLPLFYVPDGNSKNNTQDGTKNGAKNGTENIYEKNSNGGTRRRTKEPKKGEAKGEEEPKSFLYDLAFVGTAHPGKLGAVDGIAEALRKFCPRQFLYRYLPSRLLYWYRFKQYPEFRRHAPWDFHYRKLEGEEVRRIRRQTRIILDSPQNNQTGLTLRCIEAMGEGKKLITTNRDIRYYEFYHPENVLIWDPEHPPDQQTIDWFLHVPMIPLDDRTRRCYSIDTYLSILLGSKAADDTVRRRAADLRTEERRTRELHRTRESVPEELRKESRIRRIETDTTEEMRDQEETEGIQNQNQNESWQLPLRFAIDLTWCRPGEIGGIEKSTENLLLGLRELSLGEISGRDTGNDFGKESMKDGGVDAEKDIGNDAEEAVHEFPFVCILLVTKGNRDAFAALFPASMMKESIRREMKPINRRINPDPHFVLLTMEGDYQSPEKRLWSLRKYLESTLKEQEIGICLEPGGSHCFTRGGDIRYLTLIHDLQPFDLPKNFSLRKRIGRRILYEWTFHHSDVLIAVSDFTRERICHYAPYAERKIIRIPDAVTLHQRKEEDPENKDATSEQSLSSWEADTADIRKKTGIQWGSYYFTVSSCLPHKNLETLLRVMAELKRRQKIRPSEWITGRRDMPEKLLIAGIPQEKPGGRRRKHLEKLIRKYHLEGNVYLLGPVTDRERNALYQGCTAFIFPSLYEGFGMPPVEAVLAGAPAVIAAKTASIPEVLSPFETEGSIHTHRNEKTESGSEKTERSEAEKTQGLERTKNQTRIYFVDKPEDPDSWLIAMQSAWLIAFTDALQHTWERHHKRRNGSKLKGEQVPVSNNPYAPKKIAEAYLRVIAEAAGWKTGVTGQEKTDRLRIAKSLKSTESERGA